MKTYLRVLEAIESAGVKAWLVGDPVRNVVMGVAPSSLTVAVAPCDLGVLAKSVGGDAVVRNDAFPALSATILGIRTEIACVVGGGIEADLARRDFTMNAIAIRSDDSFVDPFNGRHDIRNALVRITGDDIELVESDPIRIIRMLRFAAELNMNIFWKSETDVRVFISRNADRIRNTPPERWGREILKGMRRRPYDFIYLCDHYNLLPFFLEELEHLKEIGIEGGGTLFDHTLDTARVAQEFLAGRKRRENDMAFSVAALFHHVGSVGSQPVDTATAAEIALKHLRAWNIGSEIGDLVSSVIKNYRFCFQAKNEDELCAAALKYGFEALEMIFDMAICNSQADKMKNMDMLVANKWRLGEVIRRFDETRRRTEGSMRYLTGDEVMKTLDLKPGKVVGEILYELDMAVGTGLVNNKKEASEWLLKRGAGGK
ncbi:MAG: hypothetical protein LBD04_11600 [Synergistaceae bacterium]|jgi:tRNA nucleotidyltransferase/poly(A) polymerase|nr:hypothetical protein [Synergistaceae bacterium]